MSKKSLGGTAVWTASSTLIKIGVALLLVKLFSVKFGAEGLGQASNFMQLITVLGVFAGAGIFNGVTKYVAEFEDDENHLKQLFATSASIIWYFSAFLAVIFIAFAQPISQFLFYSSDYTKVMYATALCQFGIANSNYALAILKGYRNAKANAISIIIGSLLGTIAFVIGVFAFGYNGALVGLVLMPALSIIPAFFYLKKQAVRLRPDFANFSTDQAKLLLKYTLMVFITAVTLPVGYYLLRTLLAEHYSLKDIGLWQGTAKISDAYLQFITATFSVYLLPTFAKLHEKAEIKRELFKTIKFVAVAVIAISFIIYLLRDWIILILYSKEFAPMEALFKWQLSGDVFKVLAYIFGYLIVAKASLKLYVLAEISQFILLVGTGYLLIPSNGALGATQAYFVTYFGYFCLCVIGFGMYLKRR